MDYNHIHINHSWLSFLEEELQKEYYKNLISFLKEEDKQYSIFPEAKNIFYVFNNTPLEQLKVVVIGQDPYHGKGQANGLAFSVNRSCKIPPSLKNIYKELKTDINIEIPQHGNLSAWAKQGVLLLNTVLTVREGEAGSHQNKGWEFFTDAVIHKLSIQKEKLVFILWGKWAQSKQTLINPKKHHIITSTHPSPFSAHRGFLGSKPFSQTNTYLKSVGKQPIDWKL